MKNKRKNEKPENERISSKNIFVKIIIIIICFSS